MRYTKEVFQRLSRGKFISANSIDAETRAIYDDLEQCREEYEAYFEQIDFQLLGGNGYFYFSRRDSKVDTMNKLQAMFQWIDILDFLKAFDTTFAAGTQFNLAQIEVQLSNDFELKDKLKALFPDKSSHREKLEYLVKQMLDHDFAEAVNEVEGIYQVTTAFHYIEEIVMTLTIEEEVKNEIPE